MKIDKILLFFSFVTGLSAYLDGGSGSMLLQLLLGGLAGLATVGKLYWYKIKSFFCNKKD